MWGAASILFRCARRSGTPVWARGSRSSGRSPHCVAPPAPGGRRAAPVAPQLGGVRGGGECGGPSGPLTMPPDSLGGGGRHGSPGPGGRPSAGGSRPSPAPLYLEPDPRAGPRWGPSSPRPLSRGAGRPGAAVRVSGQWLAGCGAAGSLPCSPSPYSLPREVARSHASCRTWGGRGSGGPAPPPTLAHLPSGPSPAPPLVWGLGLRRRRVVPAPAPVGEGAAQSPGEPAVGARIRDAEHRCPFQEGRPRRLPVGPRRPDH